MLVIDASVVVEFVLGQEERDLAQSIIDRIEFSGAVAPGHWRLEVMNSLITQVRRRAATVAGAERLARRVSAFPVEPDHHVWGRAFPTVLQLAVDHRLTAYDAAYLELAIRRSLPLATFDQDLAAAARRENVPLLI